LLPRSQNPGAKCTHRVSRAEPNSAQTWLAGPEQLVVSRPYTTARDFAVLRPEPPAAGTVTCLGNAASYASAYVSPGEIVTAFGNHIGPPTAVGAQFDAAGNVINRLGGVQVFVNSVAAPLLFASPGQINFVTPFSTLETGTVAVEVRRDEVIVDQFHKLARFAHLGLFTSDSTGTGMLASLNQDLSLNSSTNPAQPGSVVALFVTGVGAMSPQLVDGARPATPLNQPVAPITAAVNSEDAQVEYAGNTPTLVEGAVQVNVRLPNLLRRTFPFDNPNTASIRIVIGGQTSGVLAAGSIYAR